MFFISRAYPSSAKITAFTRNLIELLNAGVLVTDAFKLLSCGNISSGGKIATRIYEQLMKGRSLPEVLRDFSGCFDSFYIQLVDAGFRTGQLASFLTILAEYREHQEQVRQQLIRAFAYPLFVLLLSIALVVVLLVQVVPRFEILFSAAGESLPWLTRIMVALSRELIDHGLWLILLLVLVPVGLRLLASVQVCKRWWQGLLLFLPGINGWIIRRSKESYFRSLATMLKVHLPLTESNRVAAGACPFFRISRELTQISDNLAQGQTLDQAWQSLPYFDEADILAARTGYSGAKLDQILLLRANLYQRQMGDSTKLMLRLLEPCLMLVIGAVIGVIILAVYLPLFNIGQVL